MSDPLFWMAMAASLAPAGVAAFPVNRWLIARGKAGGGAAAPNVPAPQRCTRAIFHKRRLPIPCAEMCLRSDTQGC
ncbi:MAG: DUF4396 domain-containing protein [Phenylobacterium sp.]